MNNSVGQPTDKHNPNMAVTRNTDTRQLIILTVEKIITEEGVNSFSLKDVAKNAEISTGTIYYYYKSKNEIILDLMEWHMDQLQTEYTAWLERHKDNGISEERFLEVIFYKGVQLFNKSKIHMYLINQCMNSNNVELRNRYIELWNEWKLSLEEGISYFFPQVKDPKSMAYFLMVIIDGLSIQKALEEENPYQQHVKNYVKKAAKGEI